MPSFLSRTGGWNTASMKDKQEWKVWETLEELKLDITDGELIKITNRWMTASKAKKQELNDSYDHWKKYYLGTQMQDKKRINYNRIFLSVETIIPIATANIPVPNVLPAQNSNESIVLARDWEKVLMSIFKKQKIQRKNEKGLRHMLIGKYMVLKYFYDEESKDIKTIVVHPKDCLFDNDWDIDEGLPWVWHKIKSTASELIKKFPKKKDEIIREVAGQMWTEILYTEFHTDDLVVFRFKDVVLGKSKNPNVKWTPSWAFSQVWNFFRSPKKPFIFVNIFDLWETISGSTSLVEQSATLQDWIDKRKNQIDRNADIVNWKVIWTWANWLKKEEFADIDWSDSHEWIFMRKWEISDIKRETGQALPQYVQNDMVHSEGWIDNVMWVHWTTRWEREWRETAVGRSILRDWDRWRIDALGRRLEEAMEELYQGWTQLVRVWFDTKRVAVILNEKNAKDFIEFNKNSIEQGMEIEVIPGSLIPEDKASRQQRALTLANSQLIDPITLFEELWVRNPREKAGRLMKYQQAVESWDMSIYIEELQKTGDASEREMSRQILEAREESERLVQGVPVPANPDADWTHVATHSEFMQRPEFAQLDPEVQEIFMTHVEAEADAIEKWETSKPL